MAGALTTIKALCAEQNGPFLELAFDDGDLELPRRRIGPVEPLPLSAAYVSAGLLKDVQILDHTNVVTRDGRVIFHLQSSQNLQEMGLKEFQDFCADHQGEFFQQYVEEECIYLGGMWTYPLNGSWYHLTDPPNFGHFLFEFLNRLACFEPLGVLGKVPVIVYEDLPERWLGFIELMGVPRHLIRRVPIVKPPAYRKVWVSSCCHYRDTAGVFRFWVAGLHWMRLKAFAAIGGAQIHRRRRLYIGREGATWRKIVNEDAVKAMLAPFGFESPPLGTMTAREQIETISGAEIVVVAAGAGAALTHFAPEHCTVIVLAPQNVGTGYWGGMGAALVLRQVFERIDCEAVDGGAVRANMFGVNELTDFTVNVELLQMAVAAALNRMRTAQRRDAMAL